VGQIALIALVGAGDGDFHETRHRLAAAQQGVEHRIAVESAQPMPDVPTVAIDQAGDGAGADDAEIEAAHGDTPGAGGAADAGSASRSAACISQALTCAGSPPNTSLTRRPRPPNRRAMLMPASSVMSSPMKIGRRPWKG